MVGGPGEDRRDSGPSHSLVAAVRGGSGDGLPLLPASGLRDGGDR
jgi:hypothetical protein